MSQRSSSERARDAWSGWRFYLPVASLAVAWLYLMYCALHLQILSPDAQHGAEFLRRAGEERTVRVVPVEVHRGAIRDRNGEILAMSIPSMTLGVRPADLPSEQLPRLAQLLDLNPANLQADMDSLADREFVYLRRQMDPDMAQQILDAGIQGVQTRMEYRRFYPAAEVSAAVVGLCDIDGAGLEGIELAHDKWLRGTPGRKRILQDRSGRIIRELGSVQVARPGGDLTLGIDLRMQYAAYRELKRSVHASGAKGGSIVVVDVRSGEVLAMVNSPSHNPNDRRALQIAHQRNRSAMDLFEPGSTLKPFAVLAALESGLYSVDSEIDTHPGYLELGGRVLHDTRDYGVLKLGDVLRYSSQVGISQLILDLSPAALPELLQRLDFASAVEIGLPGESAGRMPTHARYSDIERVNLSFGYGVSVTALQLVRAYTLLAAGGSSRPLGLLHRTSGERPVGQQLIEAEHTRQLLKMLESVVHEGGTGGGAQVFGYRVAGKTGTSRRYDVQRGMYSEDEHLALFVGMAPASKPRVAAVVVINNPQGGVYSGGSVAAPVFSRVMDVVLRLLNVPPDNLGETFFDAATVERS